MIGKLIAGGALAALLLSTTGAAVPARGALACCKAATAACCAGGGADCCRGRREKDEGKCQVTGRPFRQCCGSKASPNPPCCQKGCELAGRIVR